MASGGDPGGECSRRPVGNIPPPCDGAGNRLTVPISVRFGAERGAGICDPHDKKLSESYVYRAHRRRDLPLGPSDTCFYGRTDQEEAGAVSLECVSTEYNMGVSAGE
jgi:hypothetical protein